MATVKRTLSNVKNVKRCMIRITQMSISTRINSKNVNTVRINLKKEISSRIKRIVYLNLNTVNFVKYLTIRKHQIFGIMSNIVEAKL